MTILRLIFSTVAIFGLLASSAFAETPAPETTAGVQTQVKKDEEPKSPWSAGVSASYNGGFRDDIDPYMFYELSAGYKLSDSSSLSVIQGITQLSYVYQGQSEFQSSDTSFALSRTLSKDFYGMSLSGKFKLTLPTSELSQRADILTKPGLSFKLSDKFFDDKLTLGATVFGTYYLNRYKTTPTLYGANGGRPLRHWTTGLSLSSGYKLNDKISLSGSGGYSYLVYEEVGFKNSFSALGLRNPPVHRYTFSLGADYAWNDKLSLSASYGQDSQVEKMGGLELVVFDEMVTEWSVGASYSF